MKRKVDKEETIAPIQKQVFTVGLSNAADFLQEAAKETIRNTAALQGYELGEFILESSFDANAGNVSYRMVAIGTK